MQYKIQQQNSFEMECFSIYVFTKEIVATANRCKYLTFHMNRCKRPEDIIKLSLMLAANISYFENCVKSIKEITERLKSIL